MNVYLGFNRPLNSSMKSLILSITEALKKKEITVFYPKNYTRLIDLAPKDGLLPVGFFTESIELAIFIFDQNGNQNDALVQLGIVLASKVHVSCIVVRHSVCTSPVTELLESYGLLVKETWGASLSDVLIDDCLQNGLVLL